MEREAATLPAAVPETEGLTALIQKAQEWSAKSAALAAQKAPLKKMRELLHLGLRMPVEVPQVEALRAEIRRREWEDTAKKVRSSQSVNRHQQRLLQVVDPVKHEVWTSHEHPHVCMLHSCLCNLHQYLLSFLCD